MEKELPKNWLGQKPDVVNSNVYIFPHIVSALLIAAALNMTFKPVTIQNACPEQSLGGFVSSNSTVDCTSV